MSSTLSNFETTSFFLFTKQCLANMNGGENRMNKNNQLCCNLRLAAFPQKGSFMRFYPQTYDLVKLSRVSTSQLRYRAIATETLSHQLLYGLFHPSGACFIIKLSCRLVTCNLICQVSAQAYINIAIFCQANFPCHHMNRSYTYSANI